jgi:hypothetical protein
MSGINVSLILAEEMEKVARDIPKLFARKTSMFWERSGPTYPYIDPLYAQCYHILQLIQDGKADEAGQQARTVATTVYDERLDRHFCEETGNVYFCDYSSY